MSDHSLPQLPYTIKAELVSYLIFLIIIGPVILLGIYATLPHGGQVWSVLLVGGFLFGLIWLTIGSYKISLLDDKIILKFLLTRYEIEYPEISKFEFGLKNTGRGAVPALCIYFSTARKPIRYPIKPFSRKDLALVGRVISMKAPRSMGDWPFTQ